MGALKDSCSFRAAAVERAHAARTEKRQPFECAQDTEEKRTPKSGSELPHSKAGCARRKKTSTAREERNAGADGGLLARRRFAGDESGVGRLEGGGVGG